MRLIDADALLQKLNDEKIPFNAYVNYFIMNAPTVNQWISTCDYLPEYGKNVVVRFDNRHISICSLHMRDDEHDFWMCDLPDYIRTMPVRGSESWMPIPEWRGDSR